MADMLFARIEGFTLSDEDVASVTMRVHTPIARSWTKPRSVPLILDTVNHGRRGYSLEPSGI